MNPNKNINGKTQKILVEILLRRAVFCRIHQDTTKKIWTTLTFALHKFTFPSIGSTDRKPKFQIRLKRWPRSTLFSPSLIFGSREVVKTFGKSCVLLCRSLSEFVVFPKPNYGAAFHFVPFSIPSHLFQTRNRQVRHIEVFLWIESHVCNLLQLSIWSGAGSRAGSSLVAMFPVAQNFHNG